MKLHRSIIVSILFLISFSHSTIASHFHGFELWHADIGSNQIELFSRAYFDCTGGSIGPYSSFSLSNAPTPALSFSVVPPHGCVAPMISLPSIVSFDEVTPVCPTTITNCMSNASPIPGAVQVTWKRTVTFPGCPSSEPYIFSNGGCCRSLGITSLDANSLTHQIFHEVYPNQVNSSPVPEPIPIYFCEGNVSHIPMGTIDPDGDSLVYSLDTVYRSTTTVNPLDAAPVGYLPGYSFSAPLGPGYNVNIDSLTGLLTIAPTTGGLVKGVIGVRTEEYRNGVLVGSSMKDLTISMVFCNVNQQPSSLSGPTIHSGGSIDPATGILRYCPGSMVELEFIATDPNPGDTLSFESNLASVFPGATDTVIGTNPAIYRLTWNPALSDTVPRIFNLKVTDPFCPFPFSDATSILLDSDGVCILPQVTGTTCQDSTGSISIDMTGSQGPFSYLWSTGDTTASISGIPVGIYWVEVVDSSNLNTLTDTIFLTANDIILILNTMPSSCDVPSGSVSAVINGGTSPYSYSWSTGDTSAGINGLSAGTYSLLVTDSIGCIQYGLTTLDPPDSCFVEISGTLYQDLNQNCQQDPGEPLLSSVLVDLTPGGMALTDSSGFYQFLVDTGTYQVTVFNQPYFGTNCPTNGYTLSLPSYDDDTTTIDFGVDILSYLDLEVFLFSSVAKWNDTMTYDVSVINYGGIPSPPTIWTIDYQDGLEYAGSDLFPIIVDTAQTLVSWQMNSIPVSVCATYADSWLRLFVDSTQLAIGDTLFATAYTDNQILDSIPSNNTDMIQRIVVAAYDPNDKLVTPAGEGPKGFIPQATEELEYVIRFQNTGNFPATIVVLRDTLSPRLKLNEYRTLGFSHPFDLSIEEDSIMVFTFDNIMLPDSASDPIGSQGYIAFRLGLESMLPVETEITNQAAIYFDANAPIYTNTTVNTIYVQPEVDLVPIGDYCEGDELYAYLTSSGKSPHTWDWSTGDRGNSQTGIDTVNVQGPGWYYVTVTDQFGFKGTDSAFVTVTELPVAAGGWDITQNVGEAQFLDSSLHATTWFWDLGDGTTSSDSTPVHQYNLPDLYTVILTVYNDCGQDTSHITVDLRGSSIDTWGLGAVEIRPNPFSDQTSILLPIPADWELKLHDSAGRIVRNKSFRGEKWILEREELPAGIYLLELQTNQHKTFLKVMIE